jgi:hypothetical protein
MDAKHGLTPDQSALFDAVYLRLATRIKEGNFNQYNWVNLIPMVMQAVRLNGNLTGPERQIVTMRLLTHFVRVEIPMDEQWRQTVLVLLPTIGVMGIEFFYNAGSAMYDWVEEHIFEKVGSSKCCVRFCRKQKKEALSSDLEALVRANTETLVKLIQERKVTAHDWLQQLLPEVMMLVTKTIALTPAEKKEIVIRVMENLLAHIPGFSPEAKAVLGATVRHLVGNMYDQGMELHTGRMRNVGSERKRAMRIGGGGV